MMTRREEIHNAALECSRDTEICHQWSFIKGAEWADEHHRKGLVDFEKMCEWLADHVYEYLIDTTHFNGAYDINIKKLIMDIRKAMYE